jgi:hypothetical protein
MTAKPPKQPGADIPSDLKEPLFIETKTGLGLWGTKSLSRAEIAKNVSEQIDKRLEAYFLRYTSQLGRQVQRTMLSAALRIWMAEFYN